ncbi:hypothetical protein [Clostridium sp. 'White wine YQ']|nr:hypothetical protein [Clostridium sp. 'White wine YQ']MDD7795409.1 hypothetical protein [Clostridium sp. 'White wine YQ']
MSFLYSEEVNNEFENEEGVSGYSKFNSTHYDKVKDSSKSC